MRWSGVWCVAGVLTVAVAVAAACGASGPETRPAGAVFDHSAFDHSAFDAILREAVKGELVDYALIRREHLGALDAYLDRVARADVDALPRDGQLALYINLYNATVIRAVIDRQRPGYSVSEDGFSVFDEPLVRVGGRVVSLNELEHKIIRPRFKDPRVHAALVCAARSCPPLLGRAYTAGDLDAVLDAGMRRFVNDPTRNRVDVAQRRLELSAIFDWYADDFGGPGAVADYVARYHRLDVGGFAVGYAAYSWRLNAVGSGSR